MFQVGGYIGTLETIWIVIFTGIVGAWAARTQGQQVWQALQKELQKGQLPAKELVSGLMVFVGGILLITPGFVTDFVGLSMVFPLTRNLIVYVVQERIRQQIKMGRIHVHTNMQSDPFAQEWRDVTDSAPRFDSNHKADVIDMSDFKKKSD